MRYTKLAQTVANYAVQPQHQHGAGGPETFVDAMHDGLLDILPAEAWENERFWMDVLVAASPTAQAVVAFAKPAHTRPAPQTNLAVIRGIAIVALMCDAVAAAGLPPSMLHVGYALKLSTFNED